MSSFVSLATLTVCVAPVPAIKLPLVGRNLPQSVSIRDHYSHTVSDPNDPFNFQVVEGSFYSTTIHITGQPFEACSIHFIYLPICHTDRTWNAHRSLWTRGPVTCGWTRPVPTWQDQVILAYLGQFNTSEFFNVQPSYVYDWSSFL